MWKIVAGIAAIAVAVLFLAGRGEDESGGQAARENGPASLSADAASEPSASSAGSRTAQADGPVQPQFTSYEAKPARRIRQSTTGTIIVYPDGTRSPPR